MVAAPAKFVESESVDWQAHPENDAPDKRTGRTRYIHASQTCRDSCMPGSCARRRYTPRHRVDRHRRCKRLAGVHAVLTAADVPWQRPIGVTKDHMPLKGDRVRSLRDEIAAVAAESEEIAEAALRLIRVV